MGKRIFGAFPTHPGEVVKDEIEYKNISQHKLAEDIGMSYTALNEILNAKRPVTIKTAYLFEAMLGISAELLLNLQLGYDMHITKNDKTFMERLAAIRRIAVAF